MAPATTGFLTVVIMSQVVVKCVRFEDRAAALIRTIRQLPALTDFGIHYGDWVDDHPICDNAGLPRCKELAELRSNSLTRLRVSMLGNPAGDSKLRLRGLPELQACDLFAANEEPNAPPLALHIDAASFQELSNLQSLGLHSDEHLHLQHDAL